MAKFSYRFKLLCNAIAPGQYAGTGIVPIPDTLDIDVISQCVRETVDDRLEFADQFLGFSRGLATGAPRKFGSGMDARMALGRSYYAIHHIIRAALIFSNSRDEPDHRSAIDKFVKLVDGEGWLTTRLGSSKDVSTTMRGILDMRHDADYHPYGTAAPIGTPRDFDKEADTCIAYAERLLDTVREFISLKEAGTI